MMQKRTVRMAEIRMVNSSGKQIGNDPTANAILQPDTDNPAESAAAKFLASA